MRVPYVASLIARRVQSARTFRSLQKCRNFSVSARHDSELFSELKRRGFVADATLPEALQNALESAKQTVYAGIDPTAPSLHAGHLLYLMCLFRFHIAGHKIIPLIGGATGLLGDPTGRRTARDPANKSIVEGNVASLETALRKFFGDATKYAESRGISAKSAHSDLEVKSNLEWHSKFSMLDFFMVVGNNARLNTMLNKESVRTRLTSKDGMSYTEFSYQLLQAYDFYHLYRKHGCTIQVGGSDQWGNIVSGLELIARLEGEETADNSAETRSTSRCFGLTTPLLTTASGEKFGKSAGNAVWLETKLTSPFSFYQYWILTEDKDVESYLKLFTLLPDAEIEAIMQQHITAPHQRTAQRRLATEVTELVHQKSGRELAEKATRLMFGDAGDMTADEVFSALQGDPRLVLLDESELIGARLFSLATEHGLVASKSEARRLGKARGFYFNQDVIAEDRSLERADLIEGRFAVLRAGKSNVLVVGLKERP
ncbi:hypothetical protein BD626DRAFT_544493 [Schizophyllum amplum]|uniref:Tyrosine--tRNA ligase n=1 Tax=Schizophyllum amplum TaxID=97359 RepID=A0A550CYR2_9AGAR|nr:hypothetical protein BD626DRAFT_544493 [Auriculariopsis ampla]